MFTCSDLWGVFLQRQKIQSQIRASEQLIRFLLTWSLLHQPLKAVTSTLLRTSSCLQQNVFKTSKKGNWWPDQVFKDYGVLYAISTKSKQWRHLIVFDSFFSKQYFSNCTTSSSMSLLEMPMRQHTHTTKRQEYKDLCKYSVAVMLREMQREVNMGRPCEMILRPIIIILSSAQHVILMVASWLFSHGEKPLRPRIMSKLWRNTRKRTQSWREKNKLNTARTPWGGRLRRAIQTQRTSTIR